MNDSRDDNPVATQGRQRPHRRRTDPTELGLRDTAAAEPYLLATALATPADTGPGGSSRPAGDPAGACATAAPAALRPGAMFGHYQLIREIGRGGMGAVYLGRDTRLGRRVAIKFLAHEDATLAARFRAEARATARCEHDNIVIIHDVGEDHGHSYMVLEYIKGVTLRAWLNARWESDALAATSASLAQPTSEPRETPVSQTLAAEMMLPVVRALVHAHEQGLVHRDLKPENIMLASNGSCKVLDFGIAQALAGQERDSGAFELITETGLDMDVQDSALMGTMPYMSPEQWHGEELDGRGDVWAVGVMLWELATGRHPLAPLSGERLLEVGVRSTPMPSMSERYAELQPLASLVDRCLQKRLSERLQSAAALLEELEALTVRTADVVSSTDPDDADNPYVSLAAFQRDDAARFFGRDRDIARLLRQLRNHRMIAVAGASGAGKSSLLRAGVIPALERSGQTWQTFIIRPGRSPLAALASLALDIDQAIPRDAHVDPGEPTQDHLLGRLRAQPGYLGTRMRKYSQQWHTRVLLMVDQFEELYTLGANRQERAAFVACLEGVADDASSPLRVALSLRSDFFDRVAEDRAFNTELTEALTLLVPMQRAQLREALTRPLQATGYRFESEALIDTMLDDLEAARTPLPLLQFTAAQLWERRDRVARVITQASHDALGGIAGALASHADAVLKAMTGAEQKLVRRVCTALVSEERTRAIVDLDELRAQHPADQHRAVDACVQRLAHARLVLIESDEGDATAELVHESLIERWPALVRWLDEDQEASHFRAQLQTAARQWERQGRSADLLWRGQAAEESARWLQRAGVVQVALADRDRDYLNAVVGHAQQVRRRRRRYRLLGVASLAAVAIVVSVLALSARREARQARQSEAAALQSKAEAQRSEAAAREERETAARRAAQARNASRLAGALLHRSDATLALALLREMEPHEHLELPPQWRQLSRAATGRHAHRHRVQGSDRAGVDHRWTGPARGSPRSPGRRVFGGVQPGR